MTSEEAQRAMPLGGWCRGTDNQRRGRGPAALDDATVRGAAVLERGVGDDAVRDQGCGAGGQRWEGRRRRCPGLLWQLEALELWV